MSERLGATVHDGGTTFVVWSGVAERIELCLFDDRGAETDRCDLERGDDHTWRATVGGVGHGQRYGFRVHGPGDPANGHACDPAKLLVDPAARRLDGELTWAPELVAPGVDSSPFVPRSVVVRPAPPVLAATRPQVPWPRTVVYEAHVGHLTARHPMVPEEDRGRYAGLAAPAVVDHLERLGVTAVELLPVQHFVSERDLVAGGKRNVWGYNPLAWGAPHAGYAAPGGDPVAELRKAVAALHETGIEVWLDVVYNHTCEGRLGEGPILSWRGFDNAAAYRLADGTDGKVDDDVTGCGNTVDTRSPWMRRLVLETLERWVTEIGIDGFRFDLAATLVRGDHGPTHDHPLLAELAAAPALEGVKLVAEPWDVGPGGYAVGSFPAPWREWNDRFREDARDLWRGTPGRWPDVARALTGSAELFRDPGRTASTSVNAVATHDGLTLADLAGDARTARALLATVALSQGVPMILSGDELGRSQDGEHDGYTLEPDEWGVPWPEADWDLVGWTAGALALRRNHPALRWDGWLDPSDPSILWLDEAGHPMDPDRWLAPDRSALQVLIRPIESDPSAPRLLVLVTTTRETAFALPSGRWVRVLDTGARRHVEPGRPVPTDEPVTVVAPAVVVLAER